MRNKHGRLLAAASLLVSGAALAALAPKETDEFNGKDAPDFTLKTVSDKELKLKELKGKVVVVSFFESYCGACKVQATDLNKLAKEVSDKGAVIIGANADAVEDEKAQRDEAIKDAKQFVKNNEVSYDVSVISKKFSEDYGFKGVPMTIVIGPDGKIAKTFYGKQDADKLKAAVQTAAAK